MRQKKEEAGAERSRERLGAAIRRRRVELGKSRKDLERETGLSYPYLTEIEAGRSGLRPRPSPGSRRRCRSTSGS